MSFAYIVLDQLEFSDKLSTVSTFIMMSYSYCDPWLV